MSNDIVIRVENLGKCFQLRHERRERYTALRDVVANAASAAYQRLRSQLTGGGQRPEADASPSDREAFWALRDISFEVRRGEVLGIIGRNGAGKSTLLKVLSRITEPTKGRVSVKGRVASLLEVGTGFHPELTGRENIFLNGAILGMSRAEIRQKFDEIVAFAEVEKFLDTPVKRYSSGMYVRLAFAVAAHLEPEILVVDEVLAVGDYDFQKKCLGKMQDVAAEEGRTVLFVSHNMASIRGLASRSIVIDAGNTVFSGLTPQAIEHYIHLRKRPGGTRGRGKHTAVLNTRLIDASGQTVGHYVPGELLRVEVTFETDGTENLSLEMFLYDAMRQKVGFSSLYQFQGATLPEAPGCYRLIIELEPMWIASGSYTIDVTTSVANSHWDHYIESALEVDVMRSNPRGLAWDFRQNFGFGTLAMAAHGDPHFSPATVESQSRRLNL